MSVRPFSLLIKPAGADCNLSCDYCFYLSKSSLYPGKTPRRMGHDVLEKIISSYLSLDFPWHDFIWQGGEPLLMGQAFYEQAIALQQKYAGPGSVVRNSIQTNTTLLDNETAGFFARNGFLVGVSIDGPENIHDRYRKDPNGSGSHERVLKALDIIRKYSVECNAVVQVTAANVSMPAETYSYLRGLGFDYQQYIPCVDFGHSGKLPWCIGGRDWGNFLCGLFDAWLADGAAAGVRNFDSVREKIIHGAVPVCSMARRCDHYFVVEHNGDVYPCDFFVTPEMKLGNVTGSSWDEMRRHPLYESFASKKSEWSAACEFCEYLDLCAGDCPGYRMSDETGQKISELCEGWKVFFRHAGGWFRAKPG